MKQNDLSVSRDLFLKLGMLRVYIAVTLSVMVFLTFVECMFPDLSNTSSILIAFGILFSVLRYVLRRTNEHLPGTKIKLSAGMVGGGLVEIHQTNRSLIQQMLSNVPGASIFINPPNKMRLCKDILAQCTGAAIYALRERGISTVCIKSHLLNHPKARRKVKEIILSSITGIEISESEEIISFPVRIMLALTLKQRVGIIPKRMTKIEIRTI